MTIYDVARQAGVSQQTVSRVINGRRGVSPTTRARVQEACVELGFVANRAARNLRAAQCPDRGLVVVADEDAAWTVPVELGRRLRAAGGAVLVEFVDAGDHDGVTAAVARLAGAPVGEVVVVRAGVVCA